MSIIYSERAEGQTKIETIRWTIPDFIELLESKTPELRSGKYEDPELQANQSKFQLKINFLGRNNDLIEFYYLSSDTVFLKSILALCLHSFEERTLVTQEYQTIYANKWQYLTTLYKRDITGHESKSRYLYTYDKMQLKFDFMLVTDVNVNSCKLKSELSSDFENLLRSSLYSDVIFRSCDHHEYKVHKAILASRSCVLKANFEHNTTECQTNIIESPLDAEILEEVLVYIYSNKTPKINKIPEKLLAAADYYQLNGLKTICEEALQSKLTIDDAIDTLQLAELHSANYLKKLTLEFIRDGQAKLITKTDGWKKLQSVELVKAIYEFITQDEVEQ